MSLTPVIGMSDGPVLNYAGTDVVAMESPCPYADWQGLSQTLNRCNISVNSGWIMITATSSGTEYASAYIELFKLYAGLSTITVSITSNRSALDISFFGSTNVEGTRRGPTLSLGKYASGYAVTGTLTVPYYRYRIECQPVIYNRVLGDWLRVDFTLS